jgi:hypothetical protein
VQTNGTVAPAGTGAGAGAGSGTGRAPLEDITSPAGGIRDVSTLALQEDARGHVLRDWGHRRAASAPGVPGGSVDGGRNGGEGDDGAASGDEIASGTVRVHIAPRCLRSLPFTVVCLDRCVPGGACHRIGVCPFPLPGVRACRRMHL